ncbi:uncharacterized protein BDZ99DRAFT_120953 [Mytilinidion resinicola]|uniref:Uncharacterized protein n=1 Tax=Mytilinidion resinicola TaxID=574789 RepID=A0A6A6Z611_9PEZI|nr:uncharacterized protein BDZ99DRAFT_120953 [Mytilinidion resinicola]KAF2815697.1 hypothetical protein BDZ99DRAFT_120953 [Mytilinidion resinicola]
MPIRQRIKRALTRSSADGHPSLSKSTTNKPDPNVYQPGEKMPPMKYRRPVAPEHKEKLEAFSFARAWRRKSGSSQYSPMGSRMPSRRNSTATNGRKSFQTSRLSMQAPRTSLAKGEDGGVREGSQEEGDVTNVGLSRTHTHESLKPPHSSVGRRSQSIHTGSRPQTGRGSASTKAGEAAFSAEDLELALKNSHLDDSVGPLDTFSPMDAHEEVNTEPATQVPTPQVEVNSPTPPKWEVQTATPDSGVKA